MFFERGDVIGILADQNFLGGVGERQYGFPAIGIGHKRELRHFGSDLCLVALVG